MALDVIWPALILEGRIVTSGAIVAGLLVEWPVVRALTKRSWRASIAPTVWINVASSVAGLLLVPLFGLGSELTVGLLFGSFHPLGWAMTALLAALANACIESLVLRLFYKIRLSRRGWLALWAINLVSVAIALASFAIKPMEAF